MSEIRKRWQAGEGVPAVLTIDGHTHLGEKWLSGGFETLEDMVAGAIAVMDANGVDAACVLSGGRIDNGTDYRIGNDVLLEMVAMAPDRLIPFAHFNPNDEWPTILRELERMYEAGVRCIKLINSYQGYPGDGPNLMALYRFAADHQMLILNHAWTNDELATIAPEFPTVDFITGHYGGGYDPILKQFPNVFSNIWNLGNLGYFEQGVANVGPEKFLLGSDAFMNPISVGIGVVVYADIPDEHKRMVLGLTQARLLDKVGALPEALKDRYGI